MTINMPRLAYTSKNEAEFFAGLDRLMDMAKQSLEIKRKVLENFTESNLYPYTKHYLSGIYERNKKYWMNHFSTIGLVGMNEACINFLNTDISSIEGKEFVVRVLDYMRERIMRYQEETGNFFNLEATPAEGVTYRFAKHDKEAHPEIKTAGEFEPYYTNSVHLPVGHTDDLYDVLDHQDELQTRFTGGTVVHLFLGEKINDIAIVKKLVRKIAENYSLPYFTITPTFSICPIHGYIAGAHKFCPYDHTIDELRKYGIEIEVK